MGVQRGTSRELFCPDRDRHRQRRPGPGPAPRPCSWRQSPDSAGQTARRATDLLIFDGLGKRSSAGWRAALSQGPLRLVGGRLRLLGERPLARPQRSGRSHGAAGGRGRKECLGPAGAHWRPAVRPRKSVLALACMWFRPASPLRCCRRMGCATAGGLKTMQTGMRYGGHMHGHHPVEWTMRHR